MEKVTATADTVGNVHMIFPVVDKFEAGFDTKTGCSTGFTKQMQEGLRNDEQRALRSTTARASRTKFRRTW